ncbi:hypothetical protein CHUAL_008945 [Chamberlinius hualienensis]
MGGSEIFGKYRVNSAKDTMTKYNIFSRGKFGAVCLLIQLLMVLLFGLFVDYDHNVQPSATYKWALSQGLDPTQPFHSNNASLLELRRKYNKLDIDMIDRVDSGFEDTHMFIVGGFGIIFMYLKRYCYSGVGLTMLLCALVFQWATLCQGFFSSENGTIGVNVVRLLGADGTAATILISWGAVLGKVDPLQALILAFIEVPLAATNEWVVTKVFQSRDAGGSVLCHVFSTYFGLGVALALFRRGHSDDDNGKQGSSYVSDIIAIIGSIILWVYWPILLAAGMKGDMKHRAVINTYYAMAASCVTTFAMTSLLDKNNKFGMAHIQNASLAGGVAIGSVVDLMISPYGALLMGMGGAIITVLGMEFTGPFLRHRLHLNDVAGVNNLHGLTGIFGGLVGAVMACRASEDLYGPSLYQIYPAMAPKTNQTALLRLQQLLPVIEMGDERSPLAQAAYQLMAIITTFFLSLFGGLLTGMILRLPIFDTPEYDQLFDDTDFWRLPDEEQPDESVDENDYVNNRRENNDLKEFVQMSESSTKNKLDEEAVEGWIRNRSKSVPAMLFPQDDEIDLVTLVANKGRKRSRGFANRAYNQTEA